MLCDCRYRLFRESLLELNRGFIQNHSNVRAQQEICAPNELFVHTAGVES